MFAAHGTIFVTELDALFDSCVSGRKSEAPASCRSVGQVVGRTELPRQLVLPTTLCGFNPHRHGKPTGCLSESHRPQHWPMGKNRP